MLKYVEDLGIIVGVLLLASYFFALIIFWPIISRNWVVHLHDNDEDVKKFFHFGTVGSVAIGGIISFWFVTYPWNTLIYIPAIVLYATGIVLQFKLISEKIKAEDRVL